MKKHKMYCKDGKVHEVSSVKKHKALMKKGCGHKKKKGVNYKPANTDDKKKPAEKKELPVKTHPHYGFTYRTREERERKLVAVHEKIHGRGRGTSGGGNSGQQGQRSR